MLIRKRKRRQEMAELLQALPEKHPAGTVFVAWDNFAAHHGEVEAVLRSAAGRLVLLYLPTYSPWLNPIEMFWRHFRREVNHCELLETVEGTCHLFMFLQPLAGWRHIQVTGQLTQPDFAGCMQALVEIHFPQVERIRVVLENLNTHSPAAFARPIPLSKLVNSPRNWSFTIRQNIAVG